MLFDNSDIFHLLQYIVIYLVKKSVKEEAPMWTIFGPAYAFGLLLNHTVW